jgi:hypothetical protein
MCVMDVLDAVGAERLVARLSKTDIAPEDETPSLGLGTRA